MFTCTPAIIVTACLSSVVAFQRRAVTSPSLMQAQESELSLSANEVAWLSVGHSDWHSFDGQAQSQCTRVFRGEKTLAWPPPLLNRRSSKRYCHHMGYHDLKQHHRGMRIMGEKIFMPVYSSEPLDQNNTEIKRALVVFHGMSMNANKYFCEAMGIPKLVGQEKQTLVIVPWFAEDQVSSRQWEASMTQTQKAAAGVSLCWNHSNPWLGGGNSDFFGHKQQLSTFDILDQLVHGLQGEYRKHFPNLEHISFVGFSAGCQLLTRWSFLSSAVVPQSGKIPVTVIGGDCGSYLYFDKRRPGKNCMEKKTPGTNYSCVDFHEPAEKCGNYDSFKYGLQFYNSARKEQDFISKDRYLVNFIGADHGSEALEKALQQFPHKDVRFLLGDQDACSCNLEGYENGDQCYPQHGRRFYRKFCAHNAFGGTRDEKSCCDQHMDHRCGAALQGTSRFQRGLNYMSYLKDFYKRRNVTYEAKRSIVSGARHDAVKVLRSNALLEWVFGKKLKLQSSMTKRQDSKHQDSSTASDIQQLVVEDETELQHHTRRQHRQHEGMTELMKEDETDITSTERTSVPTRRDDLTELLNEDETNTTLIDQDQEEDYGQEA